MRIGSHVQKHGSFKKKKLVIHNKMHIKYVVNFNVQGARYIKNSQFFLQVKFKLYDTVL